jgi:hypothetical protein
MANFEDRADGDHDDARPDAHDASSLRGPVALPAGRSACEAGPHAIVDVVSVSANRRVWQELRFTAGVCG